MCYNPVFTAGIRLMIMLRARDTTDLNIFAIIFLALIALVVLFFSVFVLFKLITLGLLLAMALSLFKKVNTNKGVQILLNDEKKWFLKTDDKTEKVNLKDYWLLGDRIFIWLKGPQQSLSFMLSRRIIGLENYSKIRSMLT